MAAAITGLGLLARPLLAPIDQALLFLTGIVIVAVKFGRDPSFFYAMLSATAFNFLFLAPQHEFGIDDHPYLLTFFIMLLMGYVIANQASKLRMQVLLARERERHTQTLYNLTRALTASRGQKEVSEVVALHVSEMLDSDVTVWLAEPDNHLAPVLGDLPTESYVKERSVVQWCFDNAKLAGRATATMPSAEGLYLPLVGSESTLGVFGVIPRNADRAFSMDEISTLETMVSLLASAQERVHAGEIVLQNRLAEESEKLRQYLFKEREEKPAHSPNTLA
jgi:two-component system sensor histidine kinase KdpD